MSFLGGGGGSPASIAVGDPAMNAIDTGIALTANPLPSNDPAMDAINLGITEAGTPVSLSGSHSGNLFGISGGDFNKAADAFKDLGGAFKSDPGKPAQQQQQAAAQAARGQAGGLAALLQILAQRANLFNQSAHQGAVPPPTRPGGGLLGM